MKDGSDQERPTHSKIWNEEEMVKNEDKVKQIIADQLSVVRDALERLRKVGRVDEIHPNMWHLE